MVAIGHTAVPVGHTGWRMLVDTAVPIGWWMLVAVICTAVPRGGCIGWGRLYWGYSRAHLSRRTGQWVVIHWVVLSPYR